jgi:hypothetical protein
MGYSLIIQKNLETSKPCFFYFSSLSSIWNLNSFLTNVFSGSKIRMKLKKGAELSPTLSDRNWWKWLLIRLFLKGGLQIRLLKQQHNAWLYTLWGLPTSLPAQSSLPLHCSPRVWLSAVLHNNFKLSSSENFPLRSFNDLHTIKSFLSLHTLFTMWTWMDLFISRC